MKVDSEAVVVGAGIAGAMIALSLRREGVDVNLVDRWEPGHPRASSTDYTRLIRSIHGKDEFYTKWARESRLKWMELQAEIGVPLMVECGALILAGKDNSAWEEATLKTFRDLDVPHHVFDPDEIAVRFPQFALRDVAFGLYEPDAGALLAHRAVTETVALFRREGGKLTRGTVTSDSSERLHLDGKPLEADLIVAATGPWLAGMFPRTVGPILKVVRQDIIYTSTPEGSTQFDADRMPCWIDHGYGAYGAPSVLGSGVKAAIAWTDTSIDLDDADRYVDQASIARSRRYLAHRLPPLVGQRMVDQKACQISMTPDTHFIVDFHPRHPDVLIAGGCSGHLFKHGPVFGDYVCGVGLRRWGAADRFRLGARGALSAGDSPSGR